MYVASKKLSSTDPESVFLSRRLIEFLKYLFPLTFEFRENIKFPFSSRKKILFFWIAWLRTSYPFAIKLELEHLMPFILSGTLYKSGIRGLISICYRITNFLFAYCRFSLAQGYIFSSLFVFPAGIGEGARLSLIIRWNSILGRFSSNRVEILAGAKKLCWEVNRI